jgi:hypothetical protein
LVRLVVRLSRLAKIAATVAMLGAGLTVFGRLKGAPWAGGVGTVMLFGGVIVYFIERLRLFRDSTRERGQTGDHEKPLGPRHED